MAATLAYQSRWLKILAMEPLELVRFLAGHSAGSAAKVGVGQERLLMNLWFEH